MMQTVMWPGLNFWLLRAESRVYACVCVYVRVCNSAYKSFPESRDEEPLALATDLWADRTGLGAHSRRMGNSQRALWVHVSLSCVDKPDKAKRSWLRIRVNETSVCLSLSLFSQPHSLPGFHSPSLTHLPLLFVHPLLFSALFLITLPPCSRPVFLCFTLDLSGPPQSHGSSLQHSVPNFSPFLLLTGNGTPPLLSTIETPHHLPTLNTLFSYFSHSYSTPL